MEKRAIVVGATSGIGLEVASQLAGKGWKVGVAGRREDRLREVVAQHPNIVAYETIDITDADAAAKLNELIDKMGGIELYFHSSGIGYQNPQLDADKELRTVETNALGFTRMVDAAFHYFSSHESIRGSIAVISSIAGTKGLGAAPAYSATKRYVAHYMESLAQLCTIRGIRNIRLHDIRPGFVKTALLDGGNYPLQLNAADVAGDIIKGIEKGKSVITIDWRYRLIVFFWRMIPRSLWVRMNILQK